MISGKWVAIEHAKVKEILEWPITKDAHDIRYFMGLTRYNCIFIEFFSRKAHPIKTLQKKSIQFIWSQQRQYSFDKLKHLFTTTPILIIVDLKKEFVIWNDASKESLGGF